MISAPKVTRPLKQYGSLWVKRVQVYDTFAVPPQNRWYDFVYRQFSTTTKRLVFRLQYIEEKEGP